MPPILSPFIEEQRFKQVLPYITGDILDLGCGYGRVFKWLRPNSNYIGVDGDRKIFPWLHIHYPDFNFIHVDLENELIPLDRQFDTVLFLAVIEHLSNPSLILSQIPKFLKPDGRLIITTPTPFGNQVHTLGSKINLFNAQAVDEHEIIYNFETLSPLILSNGLQIDNYRKFLFRGNQLFICTLSR